MASWIDYESPKNQFRNSNGRNGFFWQVYGTNVGVADDLILDLPSGLERFDIHMLELIPLELGAATEFDPVIYRYVGDTLVEIIGTETPAAAIRSVGPVPVSLAELQKKLVIRAKPDDTATRILIELTLIDGYRS